MFNKKRRVSFRYLYHGVDEIVINGTDRQVGLLYYRNLLKDTDRDRLFGNNTSARLVKGSGVKVFVNGWQEIIKAGESILRSCPMKEVDPGKQETEK